MYKIFHLIVANISKKLYSDYEKIIDICNHMDTVSKILSPFVYQKTLHKDKQHVITEELLRTPIMNLIQKTEFTKKDNNTIQIKILTGSLSKTIILIKFNKLEQGVSVTVEISLKTNIKFLLLKNKIQQKLINIFVGLLDNFDHLTQLLGNGNWTTSLTNDGEGLIISKNFSPMLIHGWYYSAIPEIFYSEVYSNLIVKDKIVVDIGANIGDSSIYFILKDAKKVIAVEPFPKNFNFLQKNVEENQLQNKILLENCIMSNNEEFIKIDSNYAGTKAGERTNPKSNIREHENGTEIPSHTLDYLIKKYNIEDSSMKIDCEGCEYKIILSASKEILQKFSTIFIEYHDGYKKLEKKLIESGFKVKIDCKTNEKMGFMIAIKLNENILI